MMLQSAFAVLCLVANTLTQTPSSIPACGQTCISNMLAIANTEFGCAAGNVTCYCVDPRFGYGLRDCSLQACGEAVYSSVVSYGSSVCASAGIEGQDIATATVAPTPYTTSAVTTTIFTNGAAVTTSTGLVTRFTAAGHASAVSSLSSQVSSASRATHIASSSSPTSSPTSSATSPIPSTEYGLSKAAKIGLGVGIPLGVFAILALAFLLFRFRIQISPRHDRETASDEKGQFAEYRPARDERVLVNDLPESRGPGPGPEVDRAELRGP